MGLSIRRERFLRVKERRVLNALTAIESLENLSNKTNYDFSQKEIDEMYGILLAKLKDVFASFFSSSSKEKFWQLVRSDEIQYEQIKKNDPELYSHIEQELLRQKNSTPSTSNERRSQDFKNLAYAINNLSVGIKDMHKKISCITEKTESNTKRIDRMLRHTQFKQDNVFILNPDFNLDSIRNHDLFERLEWIRNKRTFKEITDSESPYSKISGFSSPVDCLNWDIRQGRVVEIS